MKRDEIAKTIWLAEHRHATGKERSITWYDVSESDRDKYLFVADAIISAFSSQGRGGAPSHQLSQGE